MAGLVCTRLDESRGDPRLVYRIRTYHGRKGEAKGFAEGDYAALLDSAHQQLGGPIVLVWDNLNAHVSATMRRTLPGRDTVPGYAGSITASSPAKI